MNVKQVRTFYSDKEFFPCPITERLIKAGYQQKSGGYIAYAHKQNVIVDGSKALPSQWWHLIWSYCDHRAPDTLFNRNIQCGELIVWMAEVAQCVDTKTLNELVDTIVNQRMTRSKGNRLIQNVCFDAIVKTVEALVPTE